MTLQELKNEWVRVINNYDLYKDKIEWSKKLQELEIKINDRQKDILRSVE